MLAHIGMLSWSASETQTSVDLRAVTDSTIDPLVPGGRCLVRLVDAAFGLAGLPAGVAALRDELGMAALVDAAAIIGNFQMMNRVADGTGMPVGQGSRQRNAGVIARLGLERFDHVDAESQQ